MTDDVPPPIDHVVEPPPFVPASILKQLSPEGRKFLFKSLYEQRQRGDEGAKTAMNSLYGQMKEIPPEER